MWKLYPLQRCLTVTSLYSYFKPKYARDFYFSGELHPVWELVYVVDGTVGVAADDAVYKLTKGDVVFHKPMEFHRLWAEDGSSPELVIMSFLAEGDGMKHLEHAVFHLQYQNREAFFQMQEAIEAAFHSRSGGNPIPKEGVSPIDFQFAANQLEAFLLSVIKTEAVFTGRKHSRSADNYSVIVQTVKAHIEESLTIDCLAKYCQMSASNLKKTFSKYAGEGIMSYVTRLKIREALKLLEEGCTVSETAERLGFSSQNYFSTVFRKEMGCPPTKYLQ